MNLSSWWNLPIRRVCFACSYHVFVEFSYTVSYIFDAFFCFSILIFALPVHSTSFSPKPLLTKDCEMSGTVKRLWLISYGEMNCVSPWCNRNGWLGVKKQVPTYLPSLRELDSVWHLLLFSLVPRPDDDVRGWLGVRHQVGISIYFFYAAVRKAAAQATKS